jgi:hypothetical protein
VWTRGAAFSDLAARWQAQMSPVRLTAGSANLRSAEGASRELWGCRAPSVWPIKRREKQMSAKSDLIEDWIQIRSTLQRQLKTLESSEAQVPLDVPDEMREMTVNHIRQWIADINSLLKEYTAHRL